MFFCGFHIECGNFCLFVCLFLCVLLYKTLLVSLQVQQRLCNDGQLSFSSIDATKQVVVSGDIRNGQLFFEPSLFRVTSAIEVT